MEEESWRRSRSRERDAGVEEETHMGEVIDLDRGCCCLLTVGRWVVRCVGAVVIGLPEHWKSITVVIGCGPLGDVVSRD
jgi:hypothetical protein